MGWTKTFWESDDTEDVEVILPVWLVRMPGQYLCKGNWRIIYELLL